MNHHIYRVLLLDTGKEWGGGTRSMLELLAHADRSVFDISCLFYVNYRKGEDSDLASELRALDVPLAIESLPRQPLGAKLAKELVRGVLGWRPRLCSAALLRIELAWRIRPMAQRIAARLREGKFDLLYMNNQPSSNLEGYLAAELAGVPVVQHARIETALTSAEVATVNRIATAVICNSNGVRDSLVAQGVRGELCTVVHNGIDVEAACREAAKAASPARSAEGFVVGTIGALVARKRIDVFLQALQALNAQGYTVRGLVVGEGPERKRLERQAHDLGLAQRVTFTGFAAQPLEWLRSMDVFVLSSDKEGFSKVVLEAMALGKPVVSSRIVGPSELIIDGETGTLVSPGDAAAFAAAIAQLLANPGLRQQYSAAAQTRARTTFSLDAYVSGVLEVLQRSARSACTRDR